MALRILNRSFSAGEITPELFGRLDLPKVQEGLALCRNFITLPHGPAINRPGTEYVAEVASSANVTRLIPFTYSNGQTFAIELGGTYFRFHTQGGTLQCGTLPAYVSSHAATISDASPAVVGWAGHGLSANAPVSFTTTGGLPIGLSPGVTYYVVNPTTDTFEFATAVDGSSIDTALSNSTVSISIASPGVVAWSAHGLANGAAVAFSTTGALPTGIAAGTVYYVVSATTDAFEIAATPGGTAIVTSGTQSGTQTCAALNSAAVTLSVTSPGIVTWTGHRLVNGNAVVFGTTGSLPTGITAGTVYYVVAASPGEFQIAATPGGTAINLSGTQSGAQTCSAIQSGTHTGSYAYGVGDAMASGGANYYCLSEHANQPPPNATYWYAMPSSGVYELPNTTPYADADLMDIHYTQSADVVTLVHPNYPIKELRRYGATDWQLVDVQFAPMIAAPVGSASLGSPTSHQYEVTAIITSHRREHSGGGTHGVSHTSESLPSPASVAVACDLTQKGAYISLSWGPVAGATGYRVYKLLGGVYQYLGEAGAPGFTDTHAVSASANPSRNPPTVLRYHGTAPAQPVATAVNSLLGTIYAVASGGGTPAIDYYYVVTAVDAAGNESYASSKAHCQNNLSVAGTTNTINWPSVDNALFYNVYKQSYGLYGFIGQVAQGINQLVDDNITADISRTPPIPDKNQLAGPDDYPAAVGYYQQRRVFAGTINEPQNVWSTRSGTESDMTYTIPVRDDNRLAFRIASRQGSNIRHIVPMQDMLFFSESCEWRCTSSTGVLTPSTINVQPQSYIGASNVQPVVVGSVVLYGAARGGHIRQMGYDWRFSGYQSIDASIFAPHLFDYNDILDMAYSRGPIPILWCVSSTGKLLGMTWILEQQIAAWHQHDTGNGDVFESVCTISENGEDMLYCVVRRTINGQSKRFVERLHTRLYSTLADAHYVDSGATYNGTGSLSGTFTRSGTAMTCTITGHGLADGQKYWFAFSDAGFGALPAGQRYTVTVVDANTFTLTVPDSGDTAGTITSTHTGSYTRDWTTLSCTLSSHGLSTGQNCWLAFSDTALGAAPGGLSYTVESIPLVQGVPDPNSFSVDVPTKVAISFADPAVVTLANHGLAAGAEVIFFTTGALPTGLAAATPYYVVNPDANSFELSSTSGGTAISTVAPSSAVTISTGTPAVITWSGHGLAAGTAVSFSTTGTLPGGLFAGQVYYVTNPATDTFQIAATPNGAAIATTSSGSGTQTCTTTQSGVHTCCHVTSGTVAISNGAPAIVTWNSHGLAADTPVMFSTTGTLPAGIAAGTTYYVLPVDANTFQIAASVNGAAIATTSAGTGTQSCVGSANPASGTVTFLPNSFTGLTWLEGMTVNILADGAVMPPQTVANGAITLPVGATQVHIGLPITAQLEIPPVASQMDTAFAQGLPKNINKAFLRVYRSSGILAGPDFNSLVPYRQRSTENPGSPPAMVSDEVELVLDAAWGASGQVCVQQSDPLPLDIGSITLEVATGGGV